MSEAHELSIPSELSPRAAAIVADIKARFVAEPRATLTRTESLTLGGWKLSTQLNKEKTGAILSILDGSARRIMVRSLYQHLIDLAIASYPVDGPAARARSRQSKTRFRRKPFAPNAAQLEGLRRGNAQRAAEAKKRREATDLEKV
jgi:hypothetical protein